VELRRDGYFYDWQIMNNRPWGNGREVSLPAATSFFGLQMLGMPISFASAESWWVNAIRDMMTIAYRHSL
jgi:hypothetical protein